MFAVTETSPLTGRQGVLHPATLLLAWAGLILVLPFISPAVLALLLAPALLAALVFAGRRTRRLLYRARWLLLSLALLFAFSTPGLALPGWPGEIGMTQDGLKLAMEHVLRLTTLLVTLSLLHETIGTAGLLTGLYWLLAPVRHWKNLRERIVVRLLLVVDFVESGNHGSGWRAWLDDNDAGPRSVTLALRQARWQDALVLLLVVCGVAAVLAW